MTPERKEEIRVCMEAMTSSPSREGMMLKDLLAEIGRLEKSVAKSQAREEFLSMCMKAGDPQPCRNCGRVVLAGRCCNNPDVPPAVVSGVPLEEHQKAVQEAELHGVRRGLEAAIAACLNLAKAGHHRGRSYGGACLHCAEDIGSLTPEAICLEVRDDVTVRSE